MAKYLCVCGEEIRTSGDIPNPIEWLYISDVDYDDYSGMVDRQEPYRAFGHAFVCPRSGHIWIFKEGFDGDPTGYAPLENAVREES
jgi:hypothetical protein